MHNVTHREENMQEKKEDQEKTGEGPEVSQKPEVDDNRQSVISESKYFEGIRKGFLDKYKHGRLIGLIAFLLLFIFEIAILYYWVLPKVILAIWGWGGEVWYKGIIAVIAEFTLICIILSIVYFTSISLILKIIALYSEEEEQKSKKPWEELEKEEQIVEDLIREKDEAGLFPLIRYSRKQLETYYVISIQQAKKSFKYSAFAMFVGFFIILTGIASAFGFFDIIFPDIKSVDINSVVIAGGVLAEMISALFLWVYNKSSSQLTYFYNRQIQAHNVILSFRIADSMGNTLKDEAKREIVKGILETSMTYPPDIKLPTTEGFQKFFKIKH